MRASADSAAEELARYHAIRAGRAVRHWTDPDGAFRLDARLTPDAGGRLLSVLRPEADARFHAARKAQHPEPPAAYLADALLAAVCGETVSGDGERGGPALQGTPGHREHPGRRGGTAPGPCPGGRDLRHPRGGPRARGRGPAPAL